MRLWHTANHKRRIEGAHQKLAGNLDAISGNCIGVWGQVAVQGDVSGLKGCLSGLTGHCENLRGQVSRIRGDLSNLRGLIQDRLVGDVSGLHGDLTGVWGNATGLTGDVAELLDQGTLWAVDQQLNLEIFASRYHLSMEFFDNSGSPALIGFHALQDRPLHWMNVRPDSMHGFIVGPMPTICRRFPNQEIIKVAVPSEADWQISDELDVLHTDRIYAIEHVGQLVSNALI